MDFDLTVDANKRSTDYRTSAENTEFSGWGMKAGLKAIDAALNAALGELPMQKITSAIRKAAATQRQQEGALPVLEAPNSSNRSFSRAGSGRISFPGPARRLFPA